MTTTNWTQHELVIQQIKNKFCQPTMYKVLCSVPTTTRKRGKKEKQVYIVNPLFSRIPVIFKLHFQKQHNELSEDNLVLNGG